MGSMVSRISRGQGHELLNKLEAAGLDDTLAQRIIDSKGNDLARKLVRLIQNGGFEPTTSQQRARVICGRNMFGIEEAIKLFGVNPTKQQITALSEVPFSEATLEESKESHILVALFPLSILEIRSKVASDKRLFYNQDWYNKESFAKERGDEILWQLVRKTPVENSTLKNYQEQQRLLGANETVPTARILVYTTIGHFLATGERLFGRVYVRSSDVASDGRHVDVGLFDSDGLVVRSYWDDSHYDDLGLASARKSE